MHFFNFVYDNGHFAHYVSLKDPMADMVVLGPFWTFTAQVRVKQARETRFWTLKRSETKFYWVLGRQQSKFQHSAVILLSELSCSDTGTVLASCPNSSRNLWQLVQNLVSDLFRVQKRVFRACVTWSGAVKVQDAPKTTIPSIGSLTDT